MHCNIGRITLAAPAKVNLHLAVLGKRPDGYHELLTLMQPLDLHDRVSIDLAEDDLRFECGQKDLCADNLVMRAAQAFFQRTGETARGLFVLEKNIPVAAGLGGGSSDAAAALLGLNALHNQALPPEDVLALARDLGADVPFFLAGTTALCGGVGEKVWPRPEFPALDYVLVNPMVSVSTAWVYRQYDLTWTSDSNCSRMTRRAGLGAGLPAILCNDLEGVTLKAHPVLNQIKGALLQEGASGALMSGSGPTVFGVYQDQSSAEAAARRIARANQDWWVRVCRGLCGAA